MKVVLLSVDCLRRDHVTREYMPNTEELMGESVRFEECIATGTRTADAMPMLISSTYPSSYGGVGLTKGQNPIGELLTSHPTALFHSNVNLQSQFGYDRGFDDIFDFKTISEVEKHRKEANPIKSPLVNIAEKTGIEKGGTIWDFGKKIIGSFNKPATLPYATAEETLAKFREWKTTHRNYFCWVHLMDPHPPYSVRPNYIDEDLSEESVERVSGRTFTVTDSGQMKDDFTEADRDTIKELYRSEIRYLDEHLAKVITELINEGASVILTADHGEHLFEYDGGYGHHTGIWDELVDIPLCIWSPNLQSEKRDQRASLLDIAPTIADLFDIQPSETYEGTSLLEANQAENPIIGERMDGFKSEVHFVYCDTEDGRVGYYPQQDKWIRLTETRDAIYEVSPSDIESAAVPIQKHLSSQTIKNRQVEIDEETEQRLADLGYR